ncbi:hypothetical protein NADFUDRAFT_42845 [Nadsonia fulvescens var. elongata DSM 6958]|uniref:Uncharacterized protein n=1 Tax=Nadsonia fulvescens var. elongata DSM 6958 TaxID=857566 RepID=A0A1E3PGI5_9ASCO|nr:hypothetical protein NADFUDRAFT_42845 [Nadsonia fulvescens var. elongata DSM 6958]
MITKTYSRKRSRGILPETPNNNCTVRELSLDHNVEYRPLPSMGEQLEPQKARFINSRSGIPGLYSDGLDYVDAQKYRICGTVSYDNSPSSLFDTNQPVFQPHSQPRKREIAIPSPCTPEKSIKNKIIIPSTSPTFTPLTKTLMKKEYFSRKTLPVSPTPKRSNVTKKSISRGVVHDYGSRTKARENLGAEANEGEEFDNKVVILSSQWWENDNEMITRNKIKEKKIQLESKEITEKSAEIYHRSTHQHLRIDFSEYGVNEDDGRVDPLERSYDNDDIYSPDYEMLGFLSSQPRKGNENDYMNSENEEKNTEDTSLSIRYPNEQENQLYLDSFKTETQAHESTPDNILAPKLIMTQTNEVGPLNSIGRDVLQSFSDLPKDTFNYTQTQRIHTTLPFKFEKFSSFLESLPEPPSLTGLESLRKNKPSQNSQIIKDIIKELEDERQLRSQELSFKCNSSYKATDTTRAQNPSPIIKSSSESLILQTDNMFDREIILSDEDIIISDSDEVIPDSEDEDEDDKHNDSGFPDQVEMEQNLARHLDIQLSKSDSSGPSSSQWFTGDTVLESLPLPPQRLTSMTSIFESRIYDSKEK